MINKNNYETYFMSYIDNELNAAERADVEAFVLTDSKYAEELAIFEKTKLHAPNIEMEDKIFLYRFPEMEASLDIDFKKSLYKKEGPVGKIIFTPNLMRASFAIAAMLILFIGLQLFKSESNIVESNIVNSTLKDKTALAITNNSSINSKQTENTILPNEVNEAAINKNSTAVLSRLAISKKINNAKFTIAESATTNQAGFEDQAIVNNNMNTNIINTTEGLSQTSRENENNNKLTAKFNQTQISSTALETMANEEEKIILPTNYKEIDTEEEDRTINIGMIEIDGAAFRGITRKFSALLKRNKIDKEK
jgi:hypothetical protein